ncbi:hypothetical protein [Granulicella sp. dw_53]|uniref:hypothetical protein n=1 Tax=Granulicella sp. dw_53 TaxID=2719792 RepID=UPI001BD6A18A|nr:hypothetical protein [Granulicella sp. dw_53]
MLHTPLSNSLEAPLGESSQNLATAQVLILTGRDAILEHHILLQDYACKTGQFASMHGLQFTLNQEYAARKIPHLVCLIAPGAQAASLTLNSLLGCALFFEYHIRFWKTGIFATGDNTGVRTVFAPPELRVDVTAFTAAELLRNGRIVLASFKLPTDLPCHPHFPAGLSGLWATQDREIYDHLPLASTFDATLSTLGKRTRTHLRYYRKRVQEELPCEFVADVTPYIDRSQLAALNSSSLDPISQHTFDLQYETTARTPGGFVCGLRHADGRWLSLAGGWRQHSTTLLQWQSNARGFEKFSLGTAFRAFLIEDEISRGAARLSFFGGTSHPMGHSFPIDRVVDLVLRRRGLLADVLVRLAPALYDRNQNLATRGNLLGDVLRVRSLQWSPIQSKAAHHATRSQL